MSGHVRALPVELDRLQGGWLPLSAWRLADLAAAGVSMMAGTEDRPELGTDPVSVATATARLHAEGIVGDGPSAADPAVAGRRAELAFLARGYAGAPGMATAVLSSDKGPDGLGAEQVQLRLFPAKTAAGELVLGSLLIDRDRPEALAAVVPPLMAGQSVAAHLVRHGHTAEWLQEAGRISLLTVRSHTIGGLSGTTRVVTIYRGENVFNLFDQHGGQSGTLSIADFASWFADVVAKAVS